ncbi:hypothetical protein [Bradyrhizobium sp. NP1]|uniref:hypothetical protein n=1 Tax=Bradyrhizobium sp. NP1 TaxID=3049772 RepID=UPI0025A517BD|nr:hypothetical protein [Bradyrhizobium sp. NP1]WJR76415.1 hypothetical protein QOU61_27135 [Bradyrhizobium sp. NP1]
MQRNFDELSPSDRRFLTNWTAAVLAIHGGLVLVLIAIATGYPAASDRISEAVQAEYLVNVPSVSEPTQVAQPRREIKTAGQLEASAQR